MPPIATPVFLASLRAIPHLPAHSWYYLASVTLALLNRPAEIPGIYTLAAAAAPGDVLNRTREALLKAAAIGGLPSTINALNALRTAVPEALLEAPSPTARRRGVRMESGDALWDSIYGKVGPRVMRGMERSYDDLGVVARAAYAGVLADESVLGRRETGFVLVAGLVTGGDAWAAQRKGHRRWVSRGALAGRMLTESQGLRQQRRNVGGGRGGRGARGQGDGRGAAGGGAGRRRGARKPMKCSWSVSHGVLNSDRNSEARHTCYFYFFALDSLLPITLSDFCWRRIPSTRRRDCRLDIPS